MAFVINDYDTPRNTEQIDRKPCLSDALDGRIVFLKQSGFWICAEDNAPELVTVHVAAKRRYGTVEPMDELTYSNVGKAFAV